MVLPEGLIFNGNDCIDQILRNVLVLDERTVTILEVQVIDFVPVSIVKNGTLVNLCVDIVGIDSRCFHECYANQKPYCKDCGESKGEDIAPDDSASAAVPLVGPLGPGGIARHQVGLVFIKSARNLPGSLLGRFFNAG